MMTACEHDSLVDINQDQQNNEYEGEDHSDEEDDDNEEDDDDSSPQSPSDSTQTEIVSCTISAIFSRSLMQTVPTLAVTILPRMPMDMISVSTPPPSKQ